MARWFAKRWVWAALAGGAVTVGVATGRADGDGPPKVGTVVSLNIDGKGDRQFKVIKTDKQPDGTYLSELKDTKSGETITLVDKPSETPPPMPGTKTGEPSKAPEAPPKAKPRTSDPLTPPVSAALPDTPKDKEKEKDKRPVMGRIFGDKDKPAVPEQMPATATPEKKPGLLGRVFGPKKPTGPAMPAAGATAAPVVKPSPSAPPAVIPTPSGGVTGMPPFPGTPSSTAEPPRVMPPKAAPAPMPAFPAPMPAFPAPMPAKPAPVAPPVPSIPVPMPSSAPPVPVPTFPAPSVPVPTPLPAPSIPAPLPAPGLPPIPVPPGGTSMAAPVQSVVVPAGFLPAGVAFDREVQPFVIALQSMSAPSARLTAAKGLAQCRHASTDGVKGVLFQAAQLDPCPEVRAECITHLCALGYFTPQFLGFVQTACEDASPVVRDAAKAACAKMIRK